MSCHHGDRIGNSFSDNIAVRPFVELFAYRDSGRPPELCASLSIKRKVGLSHPLGFLPQRSPGSYVPGLCQVGMGFLDYPQCILQKELMRKQNQRQEKSEEFTICSREI